MCERCTGFINGRYLSVANLLNDEYSHVFIFMAEALELDANLFVISRLWYCL